MAALSDDDQGNGDDETADHHGKNRLGNSQRSDQTSTHRERSDGNASPHEAGRIGDRIHDSLFCWLQIRIHVLYEFRI